MNKNVFNTIYLIVKILALSAILSSCSYQYIDKNGNHNVIGLVHITSETNQFNPTCQIDSIEVTSVGLSGVNLPTHGGVTLGYAKNSSKFLKSTQLKTNDKQPEGQ